MRLSDAIDRLPYSGPEFEPGHVWLAGAGPGGIGCVTLDVVHALSRADAVVYDALVDPSLLRAAPDASLHFVGKRGGAPSFAQSHINALLIELAKSGQRVLRLKGGDPNMFGRGGEEALELSLAGVPFRFLPGVTSALGALADVNMPATMRGINKAIIFATGHSAGENDDLDWAALAATGQPIVIYMGMSNLEVIAEALVAGGLPADTPAAVIMSATTPEERIVMAGIADLPRRAREHGMGSPALIVVGDIVRMRAEFMRPSHSGQTA